MVHICSETSLSATFNTTGGQQGRRGGQSNLRFLLMLVCLFFFFFYVCISHSASVVSHDDVLCDHSHLLSKCRCVVCNVIGVILFLTLLQLPTLAISTPSSLLTFLHATAASQTPLSRSTISRVQMTMASKSSRRLLLLDCPLVNFVMN